MLTNFICHIRKSTAIALHLFLLLSVTHEACSTRVNSMAVWTESLGEHSEIAIVTSVISSMILVIVFLLRRHDEDISRIQDSDCNIEEKVSKTNHRNKKKKNLSTKHSNMKAQYTQPWLLSTLKSHNGGQNSENQEKCHKEKARKNFTRARTKKSRHSSALKNAHKCNPSNKGENEISHQPKYMNNKLLSPLQIYRKLKVDESELYHRLYSYILSKEEQRRNGFPVNLPDDSGRLIITNGFPLPFKKDVVDPTERTCCRCRAKFYITTDGEYQANEECVYHFGKKQSSFDGGVKQVSYSCCGGQLAAYGCNKSRFHVSVQNHDTVDGFLKTKLKNKGKKMGHYGIYALDCEMCFTLKGLEVTKVSVVGVDGLTVYDSLVLPENPIIDYNTRFSGITANDMLNVHTTLTDVRAVLLKMFNSKTILVGHGLDNDLKALKLIHETVIDTSILFPHYYGLPFKRSLKSLIKSYLKRTIQENGFGHDSVEDARACMELVLWKAIKDWQA
ncbi:exonuclease GOR-like isoform X2 [Limulus polyphemus]|uniref:Exonuclease GOR-like isoform X2 n=1 Tax=Limulus polyphemus TaxID=6850 RepID=A0ABM1SJL1_LIMPO|nr:exonuclease GOR-like isoform X2 [Limulus polyphemus]